MAPILNGTSTVHAFLTRMERQTTHDTRALEGGGGLSRGDDGACAFVRGSNGQRGAEDAGLDHAVRVAVRCHGDFDEEIMGTEGGWVRHGDCVDLIGFVELDDLGFAVSFPFGKMNYMHVNWGSSPGWPSFLLGGLKLPFCGSDTEACEGRKLVS